MGEPKTSGFSASNSEPGEFYVVPRAVPAFLRPGYLETQSPDDIMCTTAPIAQLVEQLTLNP